MSLCTRRVRRQPLDRRGFRVAHFARFHVSEQSSQPATVELAYFDKMIHQITVALAQHRPELILHRANLRQSRLGLLQALAQQSGHGRQVSEMQEQQSRVDGLRDASFLAKSFQQEFLRVIR